MSAARESGCHPERCARHRPGRESGGSASSPPRPVTYHAPGYLRTRLGLLPAAFGPTAALASALTLTAFLDSAFAAVPALHLNEVESLNQTGLTDDAGARSELIELRNAGSTEVALAGWSLSDDRDRPRQWTFLDGTIPAGGYLIVYASGADRQPLPAPPLEPAAVPALRVWLRADAIRASDPGQVRRRTSGGNRFCGGGRTPPDCGARRPADRPCPAASPGDRRRARGAVRRNRRPPAAHGISGHQQLHHPGGGEGRAGRERDRRGLRVVAGNLRPALVVRGGASAGTRRRAPGCRWAPTA